MKNNVKNTYKGSVFFKLSDVGKTVFLYNGRALVDVVVTEDMVGYPCGVFIVTKRLGGGIHINKKTKKKK